MTDYQQGIVTAALFLFALCAVVGIAAALVLGFWFRRAARRFNSLNLLGPGGRVAVDLVVATTVPTVPASPLRSMISERRTLEQ